jgi:hypothetical protein
MDEELLDLAIRETLYAFGKSEEYYLKIKQKVIERINNPPPMKLCVPLFELNTNQTIDDINKIRESEQFIESQMVTHAIFDYQELLGFKADEIRVTLNLIHDS